MQAQGGMGMSLAGHGALAIWHDIIPEGREDFYAWHGEEHMPERLGIPGFLRGRRYVAIDAALEFFNLYEAQSVEVLKGQDYSNRVNNPTPWTLRATTHFRHVARSLCQVKATHGHGHGGLMATLRYDVQPDSLAAHVGTITQQFLPKAAAMAGIAGLHLLLADAQASGEVTAEQRARGTANAIPRQVLLVEGWGDEATFIPMVRELLSASALKALQIDDHAVLDFYRHQITRCKTAWTAG